MSGAIASATGIYASPKADRDLARAGKAANECLQKLVDPGTGARLVRYSVMPISIFAVASI